jgi:hypothetical protein
MPKIFNVVIRRIVREDTVINVSAENKDAAIEEAKRLAFHIPTEKWDCYDCEYISDDGDTEELKSNTIS